MFFANHLFIFRDLCSATEAGKVTQKRRKTDAKTTSKRRKSDAKDGSERGGVHPDHVDGQLGRALPDDEDPAQGGQVGRLSGGRGRGKTG